MASAPTLGAVPWKVPRCQETNYPGERTFGCLPLYRSERRHPLATCSDVISLDWCSDHVAARHTYGGSIAIVMAIAESRCRVFDARETSLYPPTVLLKSGAAHRWSPVRCRFGGATVLVVKSEWHNFRAKESDVSASR